MDRLIPDELDEVLATAIRRDLERGRTFYGWGVVTPQDAVVPEHTRVELSPTVENPYHADILMHKEQERQQQHAQILADRSRGARTHSFPSCRLVQSRRRSSGEKARKPRLITTSSVAMPPSAHSAPTASAISPMTNAPSDMRLICVM